MTERKLIWKYIQAVFGYWWFLTIEIVLVMTDLAERIFGTWLLPPFWVKVLIGFGALVVAQYVAYRAEAIKSQSALEIRPLTGEPVAPFVEMAHGETHFRMEIRNPFGAGPAHNVQVRLIHIEPLPNSLYFRARCDLPYTVRLAHLADAPLEHGCTTTSTQARAGNLSFCISGSLATIA